MSETTFGATHLLVTVKVSGPQGIATRQMYHLPRVGDHVSMPADDHEEGEQFWIVMGIVRSVSWFDDYVHVDVTMGEELDAEARKVRALD